MTSTRARVALAAYLVVSVVHLTAQLVHAHTLADASQVLLMPALVLFVLAATLGPRPRLVRALLLALGFSWLGDTAPRLLGGDPAFLAMIACFLLAQVTYISAFWPYRRHSVLHRRRGWTAAYLAAFLALVVVCLPGAGAMTPAVVVYGGCLTAMALTSTGVHPLAGAGGALFFVSDALIALDAFTSGLPALQSFTVMATYIAAQLLITLGILRRPECERPVSMR
ncbi:MAG: lysoplasmalogenase [Nocardioidaceae bacterium]|nr:lysoplasmalogenase [Nocardioidaceae bacterium]MCL2612203.1 lysoplasmalogenase [Nocardioidaceae bacterium]